MEAKLLLQNLLIFREFRSKYIHTYIIILHIIVRVMDVSTNRANILVYAKIIGNIQFKESGWHKIHFFTENIQDPSFRTYEPHWSFIETSIETSDTFKIITQMIKKLGLKDDNLITF